MCPHKNGELILQFPSARQILYKYILQCVLFLFYIHQFQLCVAFQVENCDNYIRIN